MTELVADFVAQEENMRHLLAHEHKRRRGTLRGGIAGLFREQIAVVKDSAKAKAIRCGARAGKTTTGIAGLTDSMERWPGWAHWFIGLTEESAEALIWSNWEEMNDRLGLGLVFRRGDLTVTHPNGATCYVRGSDKRSELDKRRGIPFKLAVVDECQSHKPSNLQYLAVEVLEPRAMDGDGEIWLMGQTGVNPVGWWYDVTTGDTPGWSRHAWTALENPHLNARRFLDELRERRRWNDKNPIYLREYMNQWVRDEERIVYRFDPVRNVFAELPRLRRPRYVLSMDFGFGHSTAWSLLAYGEHDPHIYVVRSFKKPGLTPTEVADITKPIVDRWRPDKIVGDVGGVGKAYAVEMSKRHGIAIRPADKREKRASVLIVSDMLGTGLIQSHEENVTLHREFEALIWNEERTDLADGQDDDESDATMYGAKECPAYLAAIEPPPAPKKLTGGRDGQPWPTDDDDEDDEPKRDPRDVVEI